MEPYAGDDYSLISPYVDSNTFTTGNPLPDSTLTLIRMVKVENDLVALEA
jgi:hypothetical protein